MCVCVHVRERERVCAGVYGVCVHGCVYVGGVFCACMCVCVHECACVFGVISVRIFCVGRPLRPLKLATMLSGTVALLCAIYHANAILYTNKSILNKFSFFSYN